MHIIAAAKRDREDWKKISMICFNIGRFGNSDPKKYPSSIKQYMPELWKEENDEEEFDLIQAARQWRLQKRLNG